MALDSAEFAAAMAVYLAANDHTIALRRGTAANLPSGLLSGEAYYATDTDTLYVGNGDGTALRLASGLALEAVASGGPKGTYANLAALAAAIPAGNTNIYITLDNGHWAYWSGAAWTDGGAYTATAAANMTVADAGSYLTTTPKTVETMSQDYGKRLASITEDVRLYPNKNLIDKARVTDGYFVSSATGNLVANAGYYATDFIPVSPNTAYHKNTYDQFAYYNASKTFISGLGNGVENFTTPANTAYVRLTITKTFASPYFELLDKGQMELGSSASAYQTGLPLLKREQLLDFPSWLNGGNLVIVAKSGGDFTTIQGAVDNIRDSSATNRYVIVIMPGEYKEAVSIQTKYIDLVGISLGAVTLRNTTGEYATPPLEMSCLNNVRNLIIISDETEKDGGYVGEPAYCIHHDYVGVGRNFIENCILTSSSSCAIGIGTHQDQHITIRNCELTSTVGARPPLLFHPKTTTATNQKLTVDNCRMWAASYSVLSIIDSNNFGGSGDNRDTELHFYNNMLWSALNGKTDIIYNPNGPSVAGAIDGYIMLASESYGNNAAEVNA